MPIPTPAFRYGFIMIVLGLARLMAAQVDAPLTNEHIIQLIEAKMPTSLIIKTIESASSIKFDTSPAALIGLKKVGAADGLIEVFLDVARARGGE